MSDINTNVKVRQGSNKSFGLFFALIFILLSSWSFFTGQGANILFLTAAFTLLILSYVIPSIFKIPNYVWFKFGIVLGTIISPIIMTLIYFFVFLPIGFFLIMCKKDLLKIKMDKNASSYWQKRTDKMQPMKYQF